MGPAQRLQFTASFAPAPMSRWLCVTEKPGAEPVELLSPSSSPPLQEPSASITPEVDTSAGARCVPSVCVVGVGEEALSRTHHTGLT